MRYALYKIKPLEDKKLLEVGCGTGGNLKYLFTDFRSKYGIEIDKDALAYAKNDCKDSKISWGDANSLKDLNMKFDIIAFLDVLYHENIKNVENVLEQAYNKLREDGYLILTEPAFKILIGNHSKTVMTKRRFKKDELEKKLLKIGFKKIKFAKYWGYLTFFILFIKRRLIEKLFPLSLNNEGTDLMHVPIINNFFLLVAKLEMLFIRNLNLPFGNSILIVVQK